MTITKKAKWFLGALVCYVGSVAFADPVSLTLEDGTSWQGEIGQFVSVQANEEGEVKQYEGELIRGTDTFIVVDGNFIFIAMITSITTTIETTQDLPAKETEIDAEEEDETTQPTTFVIPLHGKVGFVYGVDNPESPWFIASFLEEMFERAKKQHAI